MKISNKILSLALAVTLISITFDVIPAISQQKKVLRMALKVSDIRTMDSYYAVTTGDLACEDVLYNALLRFPAGTFRFDMGKMQGDLAERWKASDDGLVWTFYLRKGVKFHKGYGEVTAEDVKFTYEKAKDPATSGYVAEYEPIDKVEVLDKYTVRMTLKHPVPSILTMVAKGRGGAILSKKAVLEKGEKYAFDPIGTGPFMLERYIPKEKVVFARNPDFWEGKPLIDTYEMWLMPDAAPREMAFRAGEIDICEGTREQAWINKMRMIPSTNIEAFGLGEALILFFNVTQKPFDDIRVRKAFEHGINRDEVVNFIGKDLTEKMVSVLPLSNWGGTDKVPIYPYDPQRAKQLLKEAGYPDGLKLPMVISESTDYRRPMELIQEQLRRIGVDLQLNVTGHSSFHDQIRKDVNLMNLYSGIPWPSPDTTLNRFFHSSAILGKPTARLNFSHYDRVDKEIEMGQVDPNPKKKLEYWAQAQRKIMEDAAADPLCVVKLCFAMKNHVKLGYDLKDSSCPCPQIRWYTDIVR